MKKIFKNPFFTFILGAIIFSGITGVVAATIMAKDVSYTPKDTSWKVDNVEDAISDLYTKVKPTYTGLTTFTPTESTQTISTKNTILTKNITINAIPSTYKNLTTTTDVSANNLLSGVKAYTSDGELVIGNISTDCVSSNHIWTQSDVNNGYIITNFKPNYFAVYGASESGNFIWYYNNNISTDYFYSVRLHNNEVATFDFSTTSSFRWNNNRLALYFSENWTGKTLYYMACK